MTLHITNGDVLTDRLLSMGYEGDFLTWSEMLCEGPTTEFIDSESHVKLRKDFFTQFYDLVFDEEKYKIDIDKLNHPENYTEVILWFEYDLFCHINLIGVISLLRQKKIHLPIFLVSSGWIHSEKTLKGLGELNDEQLNKHFKERIKLKDEDLDLAYTLWRIYCGKDHNLFKPYIVQKSSFIYLSNCLKAHLKRFPDSNTGLGILEKNILELIKTHDITSKHHLLGYILNFQGYYGYGDLQLERLIELLTPFYTLGEDYLKLNSTGEQALSGNTNFSIVVNNDIPYGGLNRLDFHFSVEENKLIKPNFNATKAF
ncbi:DUF1835 domain-containing protein [Aegicerativicinus sediminis]|uniref:DUF1835 domain-containing protein n=1 Tax=Aegicerativicinus sediminis TaxID=2893202 RepID=UPI001E3D1CFC|nr:DUF1835 domain-containing protein [Aegicerativicinus sediminis]